MELLDYCFKLTSSYSTSNLITRDRLSKEDINLLFKVDIYEGC